MKLNHTLHGAIQHSGTIIELNGGFGLGALSEEGLEANNKDIRNFIEFLSRKCDPTECLFDVLSRCLERSDPELLDLAREIFKTATCNECGAHDHSIRSHSKNQRPKQWYTTLVDDMFLD